MTPGPARRGVRGPRNWLLLAGSALIGLVVVMAIAGRVQTPYDPLAMHPAARGQGPGPAYLMGTDQFGRDIFSRVLDAAWVALSVGVVSTGIGLLAGAALGALSGFLRGWTDEIVMRLMDAVFAFPATLLAIALSGMLGPGLGNTMIAIGVAYVPVFARLARASVIGQAEREYVEAARALGCRAGRVLWVHILPNSLAPLLVQSTAAFGGAILAEAALSYLGLGVQPPDPSWGQMLRDAGSYLNVAPWLAVFPGITIALTIVGANFLGDGLNAHLNPARGRS